MKIICQKWETCDVLWKEANWTWRECQLVDEILGSNIRPGVPGELTIPTWAQEEIVPYSAYDREKRERFIRLICKVKNNSEYNTEKKVKSNIKITVNDIKLVVRAVKGIDIQVLED